MQIPVEELQKRRIFIATPMYGGMCNGMYAKACVDLAGLGAQYGIDIKFFYLFNESLITRARNYLVDEFLRSGYTHLMFIDSDIHFNPQDVLAMAAIAEPGTDKDVVCGPYPKKCIAWERIAAAVKAGWADEDPAFLEQIVGDFVFNPVSETPQISIQEPVEVLEGGTGFMMIQRDVFPKWAKAYPEFEYRPDHNRSEHFDGARMIHAYFDTIIEPKMRRYLSEDYMFCQWSREIGIKVWMCPWMQLGHIGSYNFNGNIPAVAQIPNATHGGMIDGKVAKASMVPRGGTVPPTIQAPELLSPPPPPEAISSSDNVESIQNRAAKRRELMKKRKAEKKKKSPTKKKKNKKKKV